MNRMAPRRALELACSLVLAVTGVAAAPADPAAARFTSAEGADAARIAWGFWHSLRPGEVERPRFHCAPAAIRIDWVADMGSSMASAMIGGCAYSPATITLERPTIARLDDVYACSVVTHEFGHLIGYRHSRNRQNVMSGDPGAGKRPPRRATWERARRRCARGL